MLISHRNFDIAVASALHNLGERRSLLSVESEAGVPEVMEAESGQARSDARCCPRFIVIRLGDRLSRLDWRREDWSVFIVGDVDIEMITDHRD